MGNCFGKPKKPKHKELDESPKTLPREVVTVEQLVPEKVEALDRHVSEYNSHYEEVTPKTVSEKPSTDTSDSLFEEQLELAIQKFNADAIITQALKEMDGDEIIVYGDDDFATQDTTEQLLSEHILSVDQSVDVLEDSTSESELADILMKSKDTFFSKTIADIPVDAQKSFVSPKSDTDGSSVDSVHSPHRAIKLENKTTVSDIPSSLNSSRRASFAVPLEQYSTRIDGSKMTIGYQNITEEDLQPADKLRASSVAYSNSPSGFSGIVKKSASASDHLCKVVTTDIYARDTNNNCVTPQNEQLEPKNRFDQILDEQFISKKLNISNGKIGEEAKQLNEQIEDMTGRLEESLLEKLEQFKKLSDEFLNRGDLNHLSPSKNVANDSKILNETVQSDDSDVQEVEPALNVSKNASSLFSPSMSPSKKRRNRPNRRRSKKKKFSERPAVNNQQRDIQPVVSRCIERQASFNYN